MNGMNTADILRLSLDLAGVDAVPADSGVYRPRDRVERILLGIDIAEEDLVLAKEKSFDLVVAHHPIDWAGILKVMDRHEALMI